MRVEDRYTIFLSPGEFFWIVGHLGIKNLPFLGTFLRNQSPEQIKKIIQHGFETLLQRNLVHRIGAQTVEADPSLTSLVELIARPEFTNVIGSMRKGESSIQVYLYFNKGQNVSVLFKDRFFHFTLVREEAVLQRSLISWMGIGAQIADQGAPLRLPVTDMADVLTKSWENPAKTAEILQGSDLSDEQAERLAQTINEITLYSTLNRIAVQDGRMLRQRQMTLFGSMAYLWGIDHKENLPVGQAIPVITSTEACLMTQRYLRPDLPLDEGEEQVID